MKKTMIALALVLVIAAVTIICTSCAKKEEVLEKGKVSYTVVNNTGKKVTGITLSDKRSDYKTEAKPHNGLPDGNSIGIELNAMLEKGSPNVMFGFTVEGGDNFTAQIVQKNGTITMLIEDGSPAFKISEPGK